MDNQPVETHNHPDQRGSVPQSKTYMAEKLRGATVMYAPAIVLDLFKGISVLATPSASCRIRRKAERPAFCARSSPQGRFCRGCTCSSSVPGTCVGEPPTRRCARACRETSSRPIRRLRARGLSPSGHRLRRSGGG